MHNANTNAMQAFKVEDFLNALTETFIKDVNWEVSNITSNGPQLKNEKMGYSVHVYFDSKKNICGITLFHLRKEHPSIDIKESMYSDFLANIRPYITYILKKDNSIFKPENMATMNNIIQYTNTL